MIGALIIVTTWNLVQLRKLQRQMLEEYQVIGYVVAYRRGGVLNLSSLRKKHVKHYRNLFTTYDSSAAFDVSSVISAVSAS